MEMISEVVAADAAALHFLFLFNCIRSFSISGRHEEGLSIGIYKNITNHEGGDGESGVISDPHAITRREEEGEREMERG